MHVMPLCTIVLITTFLCTGICKRLKGNTDALLIAFISMVPYLLTCTCTFAADVTSPQDREAGTKGEYSRQSGAPEGAHREGSGDDVANGKSSDDDKGGASDK